MFCDWSALFPATAKNPYEIVRLRRLRRCVMAVLPITIFDLHRVFTFLTIKVTIAITITTLSVVLTRLYSRKNLLYGDI